MAPASSVERVLVALEGSGSGQRLTVRFEGGLEHLSLPDAPLDPQRLWAHTCAELFVASKERPRYVEWNVSPTGQIARFEFADYRQRTSESYEHPIRVTCLHEADALVLTAEGPFELQEAAEVGITAVVRRPDGRCCHWALAHPKPTPDFHDATGFVLKGDTLRR